jgi:Glycosyltransferases involved in cell wall biogenesis
MQKEIIISVIVPVYKAEKYINKCIDSILAQTYPNFEIILIEDGSPDNSGKICDEYALKDSRIRAFHKTNGGVSSARNVGLREAKGDLICFIDSDDFVEKDYFEAIAANANYDLGIYGYELLSTHWKISEIFSASFSNKDSSIDIIKNT